jgi:transposase
MASMIAITPQMRVLVAIEPADFRCGIDGLSQRCRSVLNHNHFTGTVIEYRNRAGKAIKFFVYDGQGFCRSTRGSRKAAFASGRPPRMWRSGRAARLQQRKVLG